MTTNELADWTDHGLLDAHRHAMHAARDYLNLGDLDISDAFAEGARRYLDEFEEREHVMEELFREREVWLAEETRQDEVEDELSNAA